MNVAIILAAGHGWRLSAGLKKAFLEVMGRPLLYFSLKTFLEHEDIDEVIVVTPPNTLKEFNDVMKLLGDPYVIRTTGGKTRFQSLKKGLAQVKKAHNILVHNAANPLVTYDEISTVLTTLEKHPAAGIATPAYDTLRKISRIHTEVIPRENVWRMQTPQGLNYKTLKKGLDLIQHEPTDDLQLAEIQGIKPKIIPGTSQNFKITTDEDLLLLEDILAGHRTFTAGLGEDSHAFSKGGKLTLGGMVFDKFPRLKANSDGDVMIHALVTAILQALGLGSLGEFVDPDEKNSINFLYRALDLLDDEGWHIAKMSFMFEGDRPRFDKIGRKLQKSIAALCGIANEQVSIAGHSGEELTSFGRGEGLKCQCLITLERLCYS